MDDRALRVIGGVVLLLAAAALLVVIVTNDDRDRFGAALVAGMVVGGIRLLQSTRH